MLIPIESTKTFADLRDVVNKRYDMKATGFVVDEYHIYLNDQICDTIENPKTEIVEVICSTEDDVKESGQLELSIDDHDEPSLNLGDQAPSEKLDELRKTLSLLSQKEEEISPIAKYEAEGDTVPKRIYLELYERVQVLQEEVTQFRLAAKANLPTPPNTTRALTAQALMEKAQESARKPYVTIMLPKRHSLSETDNFSTMVQPDGSVRSDPISLDVVPKVEDVSLTQNLAQEIEKKDQDPIIIEASNGDETEPKEGDEIEPKEVVDKVEQVESKEESEELLIEEGSRDKQDVELDLETQDGGVEVSQKDISPQEEQDTQDLAKETALEAETNESQNDIVIEVDNKAEEYESEKDSGMEVKKEEGDESDEEQKLSKAEAEAWEAEAKEIELKVALEKEALAKAEAAKKLEDEEKSRKRKEKIAQKMADRLVKRKGPRMKLEKLQERGKVLEASTREKKPKLSPRGSTDSAHSGGSDRPKRQSPRAAIAARMAERMKHRKEPRKTHLPVKPEPKPKKKKRKKRAPSPQPYFIDGTMSEKELKRIKRMNIKIGDKLEIHGHKEGIVKFMGSPDFAKGIVFGLELCDGSLGENSGEVKGTSYFKCRKNRGVFVASKEIRKKVKELRREPRRDVYRRRLVKIFEDFNPEKVANVDRLLDRYMGEEHALYEQVCKKYFVSPEKEYKV